MKSKTINNAKHSVNDHDTIQIWLKSIKVFNVNLIINLLVEKWQKVYSQLKLLEKDSKYQEWLIGKEIIMLYRAI